MKHTDYPRVSVVISTYNRPALLERALASVHAQTFTDFEVIVVDDHTPDEDAMYAALEKWDKAFTDRGVEMFALRLSENSGYQCMPKNRGIEQARGDYIAYLDDDNTWRPDHLAKCVASIESDFSTDLVYSRLCYHIGDDKAREYLIKAFGENDLPTGEMPGVPWNPTRLSFANYVDTSTLMHSKGAFWQLVKKDGFGWDESLRRFGDWNLVWRFAVHGMRGKLVDDITVDYYWSGDSMQLTRPLVEIPVCFNYAQYQAQKAGVDILSTSES